MKTSLLSIGASVAIAFSLQSAFAADVVAAAVTPSQSVISVNPTIALAATPITRAEVKAETRDAERLGLIPRGEARLAHPDYVTRSNLSRAEVKRETRVAMAAGLIPRGQEEVRLASDSTVSTLSRADVKAQARLAEQLREIPRGQSNLSRD